LHTILALCAAIALPGVLAPRPALAQPLLPQTDILGPAGSGQFGRAVVALANGNFVVTDPGYDADGKENVGAVHLYSGRTLERISTLRGGRANDGVGGGGVLALSNGNFVVMSPQWTNGAALNAGAVTWVNGVSGLNGVVSAGNSLVGSSAFDVIGGPSFSGGFSVQELTNGNYVVSSPEWDNGAESDAGAVTWGNGTAPTTGAISSANSLVGSSASDVVGSMPPTLLSNGNYVVVAPDWDNGDKLDAGAAVWGSGATGVSGVISGANALVGSKADDQVGHRAVALTNGNYVIESPYWDNGAAENAGAVTWGDGATGVKGLISSSNSLVGDRTSDLIGGKAAVTPLSNGNYVVRSPNWQRGAVNEAGAVTWGNGATGTVGSVLESNSLVGSTLEDRVGSLVTPLADGSYLVTSPEWNQGAQQKVGAVTWRSGSSASAGVVSEANSLVGSTALDAVGSGGVFALAGGQIVVASPAWTNAGTQTGAVTWFADTSTLKGTLSTANSLYGSTDGDMVGASALVGMYGVTVLANGNYVVTSPFWDNGAVVDAGAVTWVNGATGMTGAVSAANSLVGDSSEDFVGEWGATALRNGNYVVTSPQWDGASAMDTGAVTWGDGASGSSGVVSAANSLVGSTASDQVGADGILALGNGNYVVGSSRWDNGGQADAGAVTWGNGASGVQGAVSATNSLVGSKADDFVTILDARALPNGDFLVRSPQWDWGALEESGAVTPVDGAVGSSGVLSQANSVLGNVAHSGIVVSQEFNGMFNYWLTGWPLEQRVTVLAVTVELTVVREGNGRGVVSGNTGTEGAGEGAGEIDCGETCSADFFSTQAVTLTAVADADSNFTGWSGACSGTEACVVPMESTQSVTATFTLPNGILYLPAGFKP